MKIVWRNGRPMRVKSTLEQDAEKYPLCFKRTTIKDEHECKFCEWSGPEEEYYEHWHNNHRRALL